MFPFRFHLLGSLLMFSMLTTLAILPDAYAQPSGARGDDFIYRVLKNDTLIDLSTRFTGTPDNWTALQAINTVSDPYALPIGLELRIPFELIPEVDAQAEITHLTGEVFLNQRPAQLHEILHEGDTLDVREHSFGTVQFPDGSVSALPPESTLHIERLRTFQGTGLIDTIMRLDHGELESTVAPAGQGTGRFEVLTPISITGVRGTRVRVRAGTDGAQTEVLSGAVQLGHARTDGPRLGARQGTTVNKDGTILAPRPLLSAPTLLPSADQPHSRSVMFTPVPGAVSYHVRVAADAAGTQPVWTDQISAPPLHYRTPGSGQWYVLLRAVDDLGLMSDDAILEVRGRQTLVSHSGMTVHTRFNDPVLLTDY